MLFLPFRAQWGDTWLYLQLGWGGILGAQFDMKLGVIWALISTVSGLLMILPLVWYRFQSQSISQGLPRLAFYLSAIITVYLALAFKWLVP
jgi:hypothetical protein